MVAKVYSMGLFGLDAFPVEVEADLSSGLPSFELVGLPDASVRESRDRVRSSLKNCGFDFPVSRITINLAPADKRKEGPVYDLPVLMSLLLSSGQLVAECADCVFLGELSLSGELRPVKGVLSMVSAAKEHGFKNVFLPAANAKEGAVINKIKVYPVKNLPQLLAHLTGREAITQAKPKFDFSSQQLSLPDFEDVKGQAAAKRALEISAAGGHNILMIGPPGAGKSMLAKRLPSILPEMTFEEAIETTKIHSIAGILPENSSLIETRPFRNPHHTISPIGLAGGGTIPRPGELSLAHNGVLFLDELPEFSRTSMEVLRQPIEDGHVTISRVNGTVTYPCRMILIAAMNPCPCGFFGHPSKHCTCSPRAVDKYLGRISGPLLDRMDLQIEVPPVEFDELSSSQPAESSEDIRARVCEARSTQSERFYRTGIKCNAEIPAGKLHEMCETTAAADVLLKRAFEKFGFSARAYDRVLKVARTIADVDGFNVIDSSHAAEAVQYRNLDRKYWLHEL